MGNTVTLHSACAYGDLAALKKLLKTASIEQLEAQDDSGKTPLLVAVANMKLKDTDDLSDLSDMDDEYFGGIHDNEDDSPEVSGASLESEPEEVSEFTEGDIDVSVEPMSKETEILHLLIKKQVNLHHRDEHGWTALHHACFVQNPIAINMLIHAGAQPIRDSYGLLPQDLLQRGQASEWTAQAMELKETLDQLTEKSPYSIKLLAFRPSGIVQLDMGSQVEKGSFVTIEYDVPEKHSVKDYIQVLISEEDSAEIETGSYHYVPAGAHGQITISTKEIPSSSTVRFVYVKSDINTMSREVVASGCNAVVQASVGEIFQYELYLYERVVEVESIPEFEFIDQPLIVLKRIGIVVSDDEIDWVDIRPDNHIVAVNDIRIDTMEFSDAVRVLQENNGKECTKLLMQNYSAFGDFIPEKILGVGVIGKYAYLHSVGEESEADDVVEHSLEDWVNNSNGSDALTLSPLRQGIEEEEEMEEVASVTEQLEAIQIEEKLEQESENPANLSSEEDKVSAPSTIETVIPLHTSLQLVHQLQQGISISHARA